MWEPAMKQPYVAAIVPAAGMSSRMGGCEKQFEDLGGMPVLARTLLALSESDWIQEIILVVRQDAMQDALALVNAWHIPKVASIVSGGNTRQESVLRGLEAVRAESGYVAIHDGARPLVTGQVIADAVISAVRYGAAAAAVPVVDTIKVADGDGKILSTPNRDTLFAVQTPQVFGLQEYRQAAKLAKENQRDYTDDCQMLEAAGKGVWLSRGDRENLKITTPLDLVVAQAILEQREGD